MAETYVTYSGNGVTSQFTVPFPFIARTHVEVYLSGVLQTLTTDFLWLSDSAINFNVAPASGVAISIKRVTPIDARLVDFANGSVLTEADLDLAFEQNFYSIQETNENLNDLINNEIIRIGAGLGIVSTDPDSILAGAVELMLGDASAVALQAAVGDIATQGQAILNNAMLLQLLGDANGGMTAFTIDETTVLVDAGATTLAAKFSALVAADGTNLAAIASEQSARIAADSAIASDVTALTTTVDGNTATLTTYGTSINGLLAKYGVTLDVNGHVTGFAQNNDGTTGTFIIVADKFAIVDPVTPGSSFTPFQYTAGVVSMNANVQIAGDLIVGGTINGALVGTGVPPASIDTTTLSAIAADLGSITAGNITLNTTGFIKGGQTAYNTGAGFFLGYSTAAYKFSIGNPAGNYMTWDGSALKVRGDVRIGNYSDGTDYLLGSAPTSRNTGLSDSTTWVELKKFEVKRDGVIRALATVNMTSVTGGVVQAAGYRWLADGAVLYTGSVSSASPTVTSNALTLPADTQYVTLECRGGERNTVEPILTATVVSTVSLNTGSLTGESVITD